jgi:hypothetical protein
MCIGMPKAPKAPVMPERQQMRTPSDPTDNRTALQSKMRRGFWASIMTSPKGVLGKVNVSGAGDGMKSKLG